MTDVHAAFDEFDGDGNGKIDLTEFRQLAIKLGFELDASAAETLFDTIDEDENGMIDFAEFEAWWKASELAHH